MTEEIIEKDYFILYVALLAVTFIGILLVVKSSETDKFAPIKERLAEERNLMDIRIIKKDYEWFLEYYQLTIIKSGEIYET